MLTTSSELSDRYACVYMHIAHLIQSTINFTIIWDKSMPISTLTCMSDNFCRSSRYIVNPFLCTIDWEGNLRNWICTYRKKEVRSRDTLYKCIVCEVAWSILPCDGQPLFCMSAWTMFFQTQSDYMYNYECIRIKL